MEKRLIQFSGVVVGDVHNPSILNPNFLEIEGIVPSSWNWEVDKTITTPPLAVVSYRNGPTLTVEQNKLQVTDAILEGGPEASKVTEIACAYVRKLPHVRYTAVGNNFQYIIPRESGDKYLKECFLKPGPWSTGLDDLGIRLVYPLDDGKLTLSLDSGSAESSAGENMQSVIIANANFSRECSGYPAHERVTDFLNKAMDDWRELQRLLAAINVEPDQKCSRP